MLLVHPDDEWGDYLMLDAVVLLACDCPSGPHLALLESQDGETEQTGSFPTLAPVPRHHSHPFGLFLKPKLEALEERGHGLEAGLEVLSHGAHTP